MDKEKLQQFFAKYTTPIVILLGVFIFSASNFYSTQILYLKLDRIEKRLPENNLYEIVPVEVAKDAPVVGDKNAPVTIVEFADFQCPFCKEFHDNIYPRIKQKYIDTGKVKFIYQHYAFLGDESTHAAEASVCAKEQGQFWKFHDLLFQKHTGENVGDFTLDKLKQFGKDLGLDQDKFNSCVDSRKYQNQVAEEILRASDYGVGSTPSLFINGKRIDGAVPMYKFDQLIMDSLEGR